MSGKFHYDTYLTLLQAEAMSGEKRSQMVGAMPEKEQAEAVDRLRTLIITSPRFTMLDIKEPTSAIITAMAKTIITVADNFAGVPESAGIKTLRALVHPAKFAFLISFSRLQRPRNPLTRRRWKNLPTP